MRLLLAALFVVSAIAVKTPPEEDFYYAAVVEYMPVKGADAEETLKLNVNRYVEIISEAAKTADIVVFPEGGLNNGDLTLFLEIPYEKNNAVSLESVATHDALRNLSRAAKDYGIYVAVNIHEEETTKNGSLKYNTNVVFNRNGSVIARYRKYNLFSETILNITSEPEHIYFDSDFGVRFGTFTCFDILFKEPGLTLVQKYNVTDMIISVHWFSELPFLTAVQEQAAWSYASNANLLASNVNDVTRGTTGSGIYAGNRGPVIVLQSLQSGSRLLQAKLYKEGRQGVSNGTIIDLHPMPIGTEDFRLKRQYLEDFVTEILIPDSPLIKIPEDGDEGKHSFIQETVIEQELCQSEFCCHFHVNMTVTYKTDDFPIKEDRSYHLSDSFYHYRYRLAVFNGVRTFDGFASGGNQICGIIPCLNETFASCGLKTGYIDPLVIDTLVYGPLYVYDTVFNDVTITTSTLAPDSFTSPQFMESSNTENQFGSVANISNIDFTVKDSFSKVRFSSSKLVSGAIFNRVFSRDGSPPGVTPSSGYSNLTPSLLICIIVLLLPKLFHILPVYR
ncbi:vanin-like protein 3 [Halyomorpha halys]|uniref:vanin-like protein 3 n=1 Tax=Halyomorpha halys TaxID=286706 RepID=UPI0006D51ED0|nr:vanin-like protein 2 [Halyomorpha halys]